jgi:hypothetical protein
LDIECEINSCLIVMSNEKNVCGRRFCAEGNFEHIGGIQQSYLAHMCSKCSMFPFRMIATYS